MGREIAFRLFDMTYPRGANKCFALSVRKSGLRLFFSFVKAVSIEDHLPKYLSKSAAVQFFI